MRHPIVIIKNGKFDDNNAITSFDTIRTYESAFPKENGDKLNFEGEKWTVVGVASSKEQAIAQKQSVLNDFKNAGWRFRKTKSSF